MVLTGLTVNGLTNASKRAAEAASLQVDVDRKAAVLAAEINGMPEIASAQQAIEIQGLRIQYEQNEIEAQNYRELQAMQMASERARHEQEITRGQLDVAREAKIGEYAVYAGAFAAIMVIVLLAYTAKRFIDRTMPAPVSHPDAIRSDSERALRKLVIIEGQAVDAHPRRPAHSNGDNHQAQRASSPPSSGSSNDGHATPNPNRNWHGYIGVPTGQPVRER
jgi:hypothetical protein